jgi:ATP-binding protein involved in chromosome partitioning
MLTEEQRRRIEEEEKKLAENLGPIKHRIAVFSGKGGVGKTTVSVNLAHGLQSLGYKVGILDADVTGPDVPKMMGISEAQDTEADRTPMRISHGVKVASIAYLIPPGQPVVWRGPLRSRFLDQFLGQLDWGDLDFLVADLPPGTGDEVITIVQDMRPDIAIIVTTPQEVSLIDSARATNLALSLEVPHVAIIENMSGLVCPQCGCRIDLFGSGGGELQARELNVTFLGAVPVSVGSMQLADKGRPAILESEHSDLKRSLLDITNGVVDLTTKLQ